MRDLRYRDQFTYLTCQKRLKWASFQCRRPVSVINRLISFLAHLKTVEKMPCCVRALNYFSLSDCGSFYNCNLSGGFFMRAERRGGSDRIVAGCVVKSDCCLRFKSRSLKIRGAKTCSFEVNGGVKVV